MRQSILIGISVLILAGNFAGDFAWADDAPPPIVLSKQDIRTAATIQKLVKRSKWQDIKKQTKQIKNKTLQHVLTWQRYAARNSGASYYEIVRFIAERPNWPSQRRLRQRAEEAMTENIDPELVIKWFEDKPPMTPDGGIRLGAALLKLGNKSEAEKILQRTWIEGNFGARQERQFYRRYRRYLTRENHVERLERLLWKGRYYPVRRMLMKVNKDYRALAFARITLRRYRGAVDRAISKVPEKLLNHQGLVFERLRWRRRKGRDVEARKLLENLPENLSHPERWWREKALLARRALHAGHISEAYKLAKDHGLEKGQGFVEGEWLAGWISLRFLKESKQAFKHFVALFEAAKYPISRSRGAYWAGRAAEAMDKPELSKVWFDKAAVYPMTYYGQLATAKKATDEYIQFPPAPINDNKETNEFVADESVGVVRVLAKAELFDLMRPFIRTLNKEGASPARRANVAKLARESGRPDLAIYTAKRVAKRHKLPYRRQNLTTDLEYNLQLGQAYLTGLLAQYNGSYVLSLAAYNAGPKRANQWIKRNGDPRDKNVDAIDWVEMIPFRETRNYVQRVIENLHVYRKRLNQTEIAFNPEGDLRR